MERGGGGYSLNLFTNRMTVEILAMFFMLGDQHGDLLLLFTEFIRCKSAVFKPRSTNSTEFISTGEFAGINRLSMPVSINVTQVRQIK